MEKGLKYMTAISAEINKILKSPSKKPTKTEAMEILRSCGILGKDNELQMAYKEILIKDVSKKDGNR